MLHPPHKIGSKYPLVLGWSQGVSADGRSDMFGPGGSWLTQVIVVIKGDSRSSRRGGL